MNPNDGCLLITDAEFIDSEGPVYNQTRSDARNLALALSQSRSESGVSVIGYFRSHIREGLCLSGVDQRFIEQHMREPDSVFLIIRPSHIRICMAGFFFWEGDRLRIDASDLEVPFLPNHQSTAAEAVTRTERDHVTSNGVRARDGGHVQRTKRNSSTLDSYGTRDDRTHTFLHTKPVDSQTARPRRRRRAVFLLPGVLICGLAATAPFYRSLSTFVSRYSVSARNALVDFPHEIQLPPSSRAITRPVVETLNVIVLPSTPRSLGTEVDTGSAASGRQPEIRYIHRREPINEINPKISFLRRIALNQPINVALQLRIDPAGYVIGAHPAGHRKTGNAPLTAAALRAARQWIFEPAMVDGQATAADHIIIFQFRPTNH